MREPPKLPKPPNQAAFLELDPSLAHHLRAEKQSRAPEAQRSEKHTEPKKPSTGENKNRAHKKTEGLEERAGKRKS